MLNSWKSWKSKTRNLLTLLLPAEFLEKLGYEFHFDQKTWIDFVQKRTNFSIFGQCNPYHQSTYRFPPLHPIPAIMFNPIFLWRIHEMLTFRCLMLWNRHFIVPKWSRKTQLRHYCKIPDKRGRLGVQRPRLLSI